MIEADADMEDLKNIKGVEKVDKIGNTFVVSISDKSYVQNVFNYVKKLKNVTKFVVEEPTLNEIFIDKVGGTYEK